MENEIKVKHSNGYSGILYGKRSMAIFYNNEEVLHTGFRNINTKEECNRFKSWIQTKNYGEVKYADTRDTQK